VVTVGFFDKTSGKYDVSDVFSWSQVETMVSVGKIVEIIKSKNVNRITVDSSGIGAGVYSRLQELKSEGAINCSVVEYRGGRTPSSPEAQRRFLNEKAEAYFHLRDLFEKKLIRIPKHGVLIGQLGSMKWELTSSMKVRIRDPGTMEGDTAEEKSPDFADSLCYLVWGGGVPPLFFGSLDVK
jgi:phage terminase large subunit